MFRFWSFGAFVLLAGNCGLGCTSDKSATSGGPSSDASLDAPEKLPPIQLTLWPVWDTSDSTDAKYFTIVDDATVCLKKARPIDAKSQWTDFVDTDGPCVSKTTPGTTSSVDVDRVVVIPGVPARSELVVTAEKEGYRSSVFAVTTGDSDLDVTHYNVFPYHSQIRRNESAWSHAPSVPIEPGTGDISLYLDGCVFTNCRFLSGASVTVESLAGGPASADNQGPFFWAAGEPIPDATTTARDPGVGLSGTTFLNLSPGEYVLKVQHPLATCRGPGYIYGNLDNGFTSERLNEVRAPVLPDHSTVWVEEICFCNEALAQPGVELSRGDAGPLVSLEPGTCERLPTDGGAP